MLLCSKLQFKNHYKSSVDKFRWEVDKKQAMDDFMIDKDTEDKEGQEANGGVRGHPPDNDGGHAGGAGAGTPPALVPPSTHALPPAPHPIPPPAPAGQGRAGGPGPAVGSSGRSGAGGGPVGRGGVHPGPGAAGTSRGRGYPWRYEPYINQIVGSTLFLNFLITVVLFF